MADINELRNTYFVQASDANPPTEPIPQTFSDCKVTPLIDAAHYNQEIEKALDMVGTAANQEGNSKHFIFISNWWLGLSGGEYVSSSLNTPISFGPFVVASPPYCLDGPQGNKILRDMLIEKAQKGVDVRVLGWVSFAVIDSAIAQKSGAESIARVNALTMQSIKDLRAAPQIGNKAVLNVIAHTAGGVHIKMVVIGNDTEAIGFTGGLDFENQRWALSNHFGAETWHDVVAKVEGSAVQALYDVFRNMWAENISRAVQKFNFEGEEMPSFLPGVPNLDERTLPTIPKGKHHVQSLRTVPRFNYKKHNCLPENSPISYAPQGIFEVQTALKKAITNASSYIYMEDQSFWSKDILEWVNSAIQNHNELRVILLTSGRADPNDPEFPDAILSNSINHGLLEGLNTGQRNQVRMFKRMGDDIPVLNKSGDVIIIQVVMVTNNGSTSRVTTNITRGNSLKENALVKERFRIEGAEGTFKVVGNLPAQANEPIVLVVENISGSIVPEVGDYTLLYQTGITIHSKTTLIDDHWAIIGSSNIMRRSLYTDLEHSVSILDADADELFVRDYRKVLWADHFRHDILSDFDDLQSSLHAWEPTWGIPGAAPSRPPLLEPIALPINPDEPLQGLVKKKYDKYQDLDSREPWGGLCP